MKSVHIRHIISIQYHAVHKLANQVLLNFNETAIHDFRLSIKKLKCQLLLAGMNTKKIKKYKLPGKLRKFYTITGIIRNMQLEQHRTPPGNKSYDAFLKISIRDNINLAKKIARGKKPFKKGSDKLVHTIPSRINESSLNRFSLYEISRLKKIMVPLYTPDASLHTARKLLKNMQYQWNYPAGDSTDEASKQKLNKLVGLLGCFQDNCTRLQLLQKHNSKMHLSETDKIRRMQEKDRVLLHQLLKTMVL